MRRFGLKASFLGGYTRGSLNSVLPCLHDGECTSLCPGIVHFGPGLSEAWLV